jgi:hypothetical protein
VSPLSFRVIWKLLGASGTIWKHLEPSSSIWNHLESFKAIWNHLDSYAGIWNHPEAWGIIWRHSGDIQEAANRQPGSFKGHPGGTLGTPRRHPGDTKETFRGHQGLQRSSETRSYLEECPPLEWNAKLVKKSSWQKNQGTINSDCMFSMTNDSQQPASDKAHFIAPLTQDCQNPYSQRLHTFRNGLTVDLGRLTEALCRFHDTPSTKSIVIPDLFPMIFRVCI